MSLKFKIGAEREPGGKKLSRQQPALALRRFAAVAFQKPAEMLLATNVRKPDRLQGVVGRLAFRSGLRWHEQFVLFPLMRPLGMVIAEPGFHDAFQMRGAEEDKVMQAFAANRADEPLDERLRVRRTARTLDRFHISRLQRALERCREFAVAVTELRTGSLARSISFSTFR